MKDKQKRILIKFEISPAVKKALQFRAIFEDIDMQDVVNAALEIYLAPEIKEVTERGLVRAHVDGTRSSGSVQRKKLGAH